MRHPQKHSGSPSGDFSLYCPARVFADASKSDASRSQRIAGIITTDELDSQGERVLQDGLDFTYFLGKAGYLNDDHKSGHHDILGVPETVKQYKKGDILPNGSTAEANLTWCEGYLLDTEGGRRTYEIARALQGTGKSLGFSIEGTIDRRQGPGGRDIGKARVRHVAITHQPVNQGTTLEALVRSISAAAKGTTVGLDGNAKPLVRQDLARRITNLAGSTRRKKPKKVRDTRHALKSVFKAFPQASVEYALWLAEHIEPSR